MGLCLSSGGAVGVAARAASAPSQDTALVLMPSGDLREYPRPATAAQVLDDAAACSPGGGGGGGGWFVCDADGMGFEGPAPAVGAAEALRAGQLYFVLPAAARSLGLRRDEFAALAVAAAAALSSRAAAAPGRRARRAVAPLVFAPPPEEEAFAAAAAGKAAAPPPRVRSGRRLERFASGLMAIPECEAATGERVVQMVCTSSSSD